MRIAYLTNSTLPGRAANTINVMRSCQAFARAKHDVTLFFPQSSKCNSNSGDIFSYYGMDQCFAIKPVQYLKIPGGAVLYALHIGYLVKQMGFDLAYGRFVPGCYFVQKSGVPVVLECHKPMLEHEKIRQFFYKRILSGKSFARQVVISESLRNYFINQCPGLDKKIIVAHNAANNPPSNIEPLELPGDNNLKIGYLGHLYQGKGGELIRQMAPECSWADFHIVGGNQKDISFWQGQMASFDNVFFHGFVAPAETEAYRQSFDILLAPYQREVSGHDGRDTCQDMPLKVFEYMASGKAMVCSDLEVIREVLADGENALLCPPEDIKAWVNALKGLAENPALRHRLGNKAKADFLERYTWEKRCETVLGGLV